MRSLTEREQEVFNLISQNKTNQEIASTLGVSVQTILNTRQDIREKLGITRRQLLDTATRLKSLQSSTPENLTDLINFHKSCLLQYRLFLSPAAQWNEEQTIKILEKVQECLCHL